MHVFDNITEFRKALGAEFGPTEWFEVTQQRIDLFAEATEDRQWIHTDTARASAGPFGRTVAHGLLTLSLVPYFTQQLFSVRHLEMAINYGYDKVRFISPVPVGAELRASGRVSGIRGITGGVQTSFTVTIEIKGAQRPAAVVESVVRLLG